MSHAFIRGTRVHLRPLERTDIDRLLGWINDPELTQYLLAGRIPINAIREAEWIEKLYSSNTEIALGIARATDGVLIGCSGLHKIDYIDRFAVLGIMIGEKDHWGRGFGSEACALTVDYAFRALNLHRVELEVYENNPRAQRAYQKIGFKEEGRFRKRRWKDGRYLDEVIMSVLSEEWTLPKLP